MIRLRTRFWLMLVGADAVLTLIFAVKRDVGFTLFAFILTFYSSVMANWCLEEDIKRIKGE